MTASTLEPISLPAAEEQQVRELYHLLRQDGKARLVGKGGEPSVELPDAVFDLLIQIVEELEQGKAISIVPITKELSTQQSAEILGVSRPYLIKLLETKHLPFHLVGTHRRVYLRDLLAYKQQRDAGRREALDRMAAEADSMGLYDKVLLPDL